MDVLHLTDLHVTEQNETLDTLWIGPREILEKEKREFDVIVVSGDLTQRAEKREYEELRAFCERSLLPLLRKKERNRIVLVPGNHDVDWGTEVALPQASRLPFLPAGWGRSRQQSMEELEAYQRGPSDSNLRLEFTAPGRYAFRRIDPDSERYRQRFHRCQGFLDGFYPKPDPFLKPFDLMKVGEDWSAHLFVEEKVAIFGFNSCHRNDRWWPVAHIDYRAISNAASFRQKHCPNYLCVAVWHHGLTAQHGRPDFLSFADLGKLQEAGFRIGFHGHVHASSAHVLHLLREDFALIATGSLGAGARDRQDAVGQQFSTVQLHPSRVTVDVYERNQPFGRQYQWNESASRRIYLRPSANERPRSKVKEHVRTWRIQKDGIAEVTVELRGVTVRGQFTLGVLNPPFCNISIQEHAVGDGDGQNTKVIVDIDPDGRRRFVLLNPQSGYQSLTWSYKVSNAVALSQADLKLLEPIQTWFPNVPAGFDLRSHTVRQECDRLCLRLEFSEVKEGVQPAIQEVRPLVESKTGDEQWEVIKQEQQRCEVRVVEGTNDRVAELVVTAPVVGFRYGLVFRPKATGTPIPTQALHLTRSLLHQCREGLAAHRFASEVTESIEVNVREECLMDDGQGEVPAQAEDGNLLGPGGAWVGFLWSADARCLLPAFGKFRIETWGTRFMAGYGIAGTAFRHSANVAWLANQGGRSQLIYHNDVDSSRPYQGTGAPQRGADHRYRWILCVPLYVRPKGASIGVISFAGKEPTTLVARKLENLAHRIVQETDEDPKTLDFVTRLENALNIAFWIAVARNMELERKDRELGKNFLKQAGVSRLLEQDDRAR